MTAQVINQESGKDWTLYQADCIRGLAGIPDASVGLSVYSPPFAGLYIYSPDEADMGNCASDEEFMEHLGYLAPELLRVTIPGRQTVIHCKDLPRYRVRDGAAGLKDFPGQLIRLYERHGWVYHSRVTIWKCPVTEMTRTKNQGLLYKQLRADSSFSRQGMADYLIVMRKWEGMDGGKAPQPVTHTPADFPLEQWQKYAEPVWMDIDQMDTLNERIARDSKDEKHICPLQLPVIERVLKLYSNPGDVVLSPFAGIGSEGYVSLLNKRKFVGFELKEAYFQHACRYLRQAEQKARQKTLFSHLEEVEA